MSVGSTKSASKTAEMYREQQSAEKEARRRIEQLQAQIKHTETELKDKLELVRDSYEKQTESEITRNESYLQTLRERAAESQLDASNEIRQHANELRRRGERNLNEITTTYKEKIDQADDLGREGLRDTVERHETLKAYEQRNQAQEEATLQATHRMHMDNMRETQMRTAEKIHQDHNKEVGRLREQYHQSVEKSEKDFGSAHTKIAEQNQKALDHIEGFATDRIKDIRADTAYRLAAYQSRQSDPFYRMLDLDLGLSERGDGFLITATIPKHEQDHVSVNVRGNEIVISGRRSNQESLEYADGHKQQTSNYQYYMEAVPLGFPVEERGLVREFDGDRLTVFVPKKDFTRAHDTPYQAPSKAKPAKVRAERPQFPANIPDYREPKKPKA